MRQIINDHDEDNEVEETVSEGLHVMNWRCMTIKNIIFFIFLAYRGFNDGQMSSSLSKNTVKNDGVWVWVVF